AGDRGVSERARPGRAGGHPRRHGLPRVRARGAGYGRPVTGAAESVTGDVGSAGPRRGSRVAPRPASLADQRAPPLRPPVKFGAYAKNSRTTRPVAPSKMRTWGPPPGPAPVMMSALPSPLTSAAATKTPPVNAAG